MKGRAAAAVLVAWSLSAACCAAVQPAAGPTPAQPAEPPRLLVLLVVDQFRSDYISLYGAQWTQGLRRLLDQGAVFESASHVYANTVTCPGHFTVGTGAVPSVHGMIGNAFFDRTSQRSIPCVEDPTAAPIAFGGATGREHHSPRALRVPTLADELRRQASRPPAVVSLALKPRTAIGLGGRGGADTVVVWEENGGTWATSDAYAAAPWPDVDEFVSAHPLADAYGEVWTTLLPAARYLFLDDAPGEGTPRPWTRTFPHRLESPSGKPDDTFVSAWERSPWSDRFITELALHLLRTRRLGTRPGTDMLALSFPSLDLVGHEFGPRSHEVQDVLARVDVNLGRLLDALDRQVGRGRYAVGVTADHGVATIPEQLQQEGRDAGRISAADVRRAVNTAVAHVLGTDQAEVVAALNDLQLSLTRGVFDRLRNTPGGLEAVKTAITRVAGIERVYDATELAATTPGDPLLARWRLSWVADRGGDFAITPRRNWIVRAGSGTTHGAPYDYDERVPVVLFGAGVQPGRYGGPASPADVAPTLAALAGLALPQAQGRVLTESLRR